jgi:sporulation protein YlmC with PRC-barrel domain
MNICSSAEPGGFWRVFQPTFLASQEERQMFRKTILCGLATAAMIPTIAAAQGRGGGGGGPPTGVGGGMGGGLGNAGGMGMGKSFGIETRDASRINSQGPNYASPTGIAHANQNSVLAGTGTTTTTSSRLNTMFPGTRTTTTVTSGTLSGLTTGMTLTSNGTAVGTVQQIRTTGNGSVSVVIVQGTNGGFYAVPANKLSLSGGTLTTTARLNGINGSSQARLNSQGPLHASTTGIAHANFRSVLASGTVVSGSLAGLTTGLTVNTSAGTTLGTVSQIVTDTSGNIRLVIVTSSTGQTFRLSPTSLSISGGVVTTTQTG